jgi:hypothetical protein
MQNQSAFNDGQLAPDNPFPERVSNTVDRVQAQPRRNRIGERSGDRYAEEGLGWQRAYAGSFFEAVRDSDSGASHRDVEVQIAGQAQGRSLLGSGRAVPAWSQVPELMDGMFDGASGDQGRAYPYPPHVPRPGANMSTISPLDGLNPGERQATVMVTKIAENTARSRRNRADVSRF